MRGPSWRAVPLALAALLLLGGCPKKKDEKASRKGDKKARVKGVKEPGVRPKKGGPLAAEKQPHPDFPTPRLAKTEKIFLLEEPDRGPVVTKMAAVPEPATGRWTTHDHCEVTPGGVACGVAPGAGGVRAHWRVKRGKERVLALRRFGPRVKRSFTLRLAGGKPNQMVALDRHGEVLWSRHYKAGGAEYGSRTRNGANALTGCGFHRLERDKKGRVEYVGCLQWTGQPMRDVNGVVFTRHRRDGAGLGVETWRLDADRKPQNGQDGVHRVTLERDAAGRVVLRRYFDKDGFPTLSAVNGCYGWRRTFDKRGLLVRKACLGVDGASVNDSQGVCAYVYGQDGRGCRVSVTNLKLDKANTCSKRFKRYAYDVNGACETMTEVCYGATDKRKACGLRKPAEYRYTRDARGRVTSRKHFGVDHKPGKDRDCQAFELRREYDELGNVRKVSHHGPAGQAVNCSGAGYHGITYTHDDAGRSKETRFLKRDGSAGTNLGCAVRRYRYDNYDHRVKTINYGFDGKVRDVRGMGSMRIIYDRGHRLFGLLLYDIHDRPARYRACFTGRSCPSKKPWHAVRVMRRANGSVARNSFFDHEGQLVKTINCDKVPCWQ